MSTKVVTCGKYTSGDITIRNKIRFVNWGLSYDDFNSAVDRIETELRTIWTDPVFRCGNSNVRFVFTYSYVGKEMRTSRNDIDDKNLYPQNGVSFQSGLGPSQSIGTWFLGDPLDPSFDGVAAHEVGHELGMTDKYECFDAAGNTIACYIKDPTSGMWILNPAYARKGPPAGYPTNGIAFDRLGTPQFADIKEIVLAACGIRCTPIKKKRRKKRIKKTRIPL